MKTNTNTSQKSRDELNLLNLGYRDYLGARMLLQTDLLIQGATLACFAVEKNLKAVLLAHNYFKPIHIDRWKEMKGFLSKVGDRLFNSFDDQFFSLLEKIYNLRYYDKVKDSVSFGFMDRQLLGELDFVINRINGRFNFRVDSTGSALLTEYERDAKIKLPRLYENNHVLQNVEKKQFMEQRGRFIMIHITGRDRSEITGFGDVSQVEYTGTLSIIKRVLLTPIPDGSPGTIIRLEFNNDVNM